MVSLSQSSLRRHPVSRTTKPSLPPFLVPMQPIYGYVLCESHLLIYASICLFSPSVALSISAYQSHGKEFHKFGGKEPFNSKDMKDGSEFSMCFSSHHIPHLEKLSLGSVNQYIMLMPAALYVSMDQYLEGLFILANDRTLEVWKMVCSAFVQLIEVLPSLLEPHLRDVIEYMLQVNKDNDDEVALEACEFCCAVNHRMELNLE
ncbi:hypothetical protein FNV43_RR21736 [Rhamnella rubrinervis]|uniref:Uncharacterized protein n=1 Tax=Rhamnella rubrinervis TaxID=2594499 RepID=A0A8K0GRE9_9ROSA|nr:hypothetical protein FNV43_RR21736 [Rhamnella rubrinervis]